MGVLEFLGITGKVAKVATSAVKNAQEITENAVDTKGNTKKLFNKTLEIKRKPFSFNIDEIRGRDDEYSAIKAAFEHNDIVVLYGQGGIGKTTCAYYYAEKEKKETYDCIFEFEFATNIDDTLVANIEFENEKPQDKVKYDKKLKQIREYLETTDKKILFIININNIKSDIISLSTLPLNPNNNIKYLFTIREKDVLSFAKIKAKEIDIDKLGEDDLITIFKDNYSKEIQLKDNEILREIIDDVLQYNTKVVVLAARVTKESHKSLKELLDILKKNKLGIEITEPFKGENGLNETFLQHIVTLFKVNNLSVEEKEFLTYMTIIPYDGVELTKLKEWLSLKNYDIPNALWKKGWVDFLGREGIEKIFMHPIISDSVFYQLNPTSQKCQKLLNRLYEKENDYHYYYQKKYLINILQFIIARIGKEETKEIADIYHLLAKIESNVNFNYETCVKNLHTAKNIYEKVLGEENENTATAYNDIAVVYRKKRKYDEALKYHFKALNIREKVLGEEHLDTAISYNNIGYVYSEKDKYEEALEYYVKALKIHIKKSGEEHPNTARFYNNIGVVYRKKRKYDEASTYLFKSLGIRETVLGKEHPDTAMSYNNIGTLHNRKGEYDKAFEYYHKALKIRKKVLGEEHPDTAMSYNNIGTICSKKGKYNKALKYHFKALNIREKILEKEHPNTAMSYNNIGFVYNKIGEYDKALENYFKALEIYKKVLVEEHPDTKNTLYNIKFCQEAKAKKETEETQEQ